VTVLQLAAQLCTVLGIVVGLLLLLVTRAPRLAIGVLLDFLLAAGLLRLSHDATTTTLLTAAAIIAVRRLLVVGLGPPGTPPQQAQAPTRTPSSPRAPTSRT
jgi:hypothetical protein